MDITGISVFGFALVKVVLWILVIVSAIAIYLRVTNQIDRARNPLKIVDDRHVVSWVLWSNKVLISLWVVFFAAAVIYSQMEMGYRPKTVIQPANPLLEERLRVYDEAPAPVIGEAKSDLRDAANEGYSERNREENQAAKEAFMGLLSEDEMPEDDE